MSLDISKEIENAGRKRKEKCILARRVRSLKRDLDSGVLKPEQCLEKGLEELMEIIRIKLKNSANDRNFTVRYNGFDNLLSLIETMFPYMDVSSYQRIYDNITEKIFSPAKTKLNY